MTWNPDDIYPDRSEITRNCMNIRKSIWDGNMIIISIDGLSIGNYTYTCKVYDKVEHSNNDSVMLIVEEAEDVFGLFLGLYITLWKLGVATMPLTYFAIKKSKIDNINYFSFYLIFINLFLDPVKLNILKDY